MLRSKIIIILILTITLIYGSGCSFNEKAKTMKDDLINMSKDQIAMQLENSLNEQFPGVQVSVPKVTNDNGEMNWNALKTTELGNYVFYSFGDYEFRAVLQGNGLFKIERINHSNNSTYSYAEFKVNWDNGKFNVTTK